MQKRKVASIIIRTLNEEKHIGKLLRLLRKQDFNQKDIEFIVVDSCSTDKTVKIAKKYADKIVEIKPSDFTFGRGIFRFLQLFGTYMGRNFHKEVNEHLMKRFYYPRRSFRR
ncbi:MAG: glycosyltransferase [Nanoarchaeota archaeon]